MGRGSAQKEDPGDKQCPKCDKWYKDVPRHDKNCAGKSNPPRPAPLSAEAATAGAAATAGVKSPPASKAPREEGTQYVTLGSRRVEVLNTPAYFPKEQADGEAAATVATEHRVVFSPSAFAGFDTFLCPRQLRLHCRPKGSRGPKLTDAAVTVGSLTTARGNEFEARVFENLRKASDRGAMRFINCTGRAPTPTAHATLLDEVLGLFAGTPSIQRVVVAQLPITVEAQTVSGWSWWCANLASNTTLVKLGTMYPDIVIFDRLADADAAALELEQMTVSGAKSTAASSTTRQAVRVSIADVKSSTHGMKRSHCLQIAFYSLVLKGLWGTEAKGFRLSFSEEGSVWLDPAVHPDASSLEISEFGYAPTPFSISPQEAAVQAFLKEVLGPLVAAPTKDMEDVPAQRFQPGSACGMCEYRLDCKALARRQKDSFALCARPTEAVSPIFGVPRSSRVVPLKDFECPTGAFYDEVAAKMNSLRNNGQWVDVGPLSVRPLSAANCVPSIRGSAVVVAVAPGADQQLRVVWQAYRPGEPSVELQQGALTDFLPTLSKVSTVVVWNNAQANALIDACRTLPDLGNFKALSASFDGDIATGPAVPRKALLRLQDVIHSVVVTACPFTCLDIDDLRSPEARAQIPMARRLWTAADMALAAANDPAAVKECFRVLQSATETLLRVSTKRLRYRPTEFGESIVGIDLAATAGPAARMQSVLEALKRDAWWSAWSARRGTSTDNLPPAIYEVVEHYGGSKNLHWVKPTSLLQLPEQDDDMLDKAILATYASVGHLDGAGIKALQGDFLTRPYWAICVASIDDDDNDDDDADDENACVVDVSTTLTIKQKLDGACYSELPFKMTNRAAHVLGYRTAAAGTGTGRVELLIDFRSASLQPKSCLLLAARSHEYNHEAIYSAVSSVANGSAVSIVEELCQQAPAPIDTADRWKLPTMPGGVLLNDKQRAALESACSRRLTILWGPPGTGKTSTLSKLLHVALALQKRVLVTTLTHAAKAELLEKMTTAVGWPTLKVEELPEVENASRVQATAGGGDGYVIFGTPQGINKGRKKGSIKMGEIQLIVIDEASQMTVPLAFLATVTTATTLRADLRVVVAGDVLQLPPIIPSCLAESRFVQQDPALRSTTRSVIEAFLFDRAGARFGAMDLVPEVSQAPRVAFPDYLVMLDVNYRSCTAIVNFVGRLYPGLREGPQLSFSAVAQSDGTPPLQRVRVPCIGDFSSLKGDAALREKECRAIVRYLIDVRRTHQDWSMAVVTPHRLQRMAILEELRKAADGGLSPDAVQVDTVERMQGQEFDVVVVALASVSPAFALQLNRLNVALSRAKHRVLVVSSDCLVKPSPPDAASLNSEARAALKYLQAYWARAADL